MSTTTLLTPPTSSTPTHTLTLSQLAPTIASAASSSTLPYPLSLLSTSETQEKWLTLENLLLATLRTGDNTTAYLCLETLRDRFGAENERVTALRGLYAEAMASDQSELDDVMTHYEEILKEDPATFSIRKRRAALLKSMGKTAAAVDAVVNLLDTSPTDAEAWAEVGELYARAGMWEQSIFAWEEVVLLLPNAWNVQAKLGEVLFAASRGREEGGEGVRVLAESMRRFGRSVELCDGYLRGFYGLKVTTTKLMDALPTAKNSRMEPGELSLPTLQSVTKLNEIATAKLAEIIRRSSSGEKDWDGYNAAEVAAARTLLAEGVPQITR
ncbi:unnamed protein product [Zymoseptoria tritici ST99CH_3D7]|uniref:ER membrane protein complex subunit 2 n=2 Tax=Zymoseptoria tritici TaxID=1047171 RepID=A0A1X7RXI3_ZYMT9|nr:unnamed protein product [Zymoseptoria tritici ST99CH_3D7]SMR54967.1 unnamed protein product [Zymoseptoria tritici ST99CH_1E4]